MSSLLIRNGTLVTDRHTYGADILIEGERIRDIAPDIPFGIADRIVDATNMLVMPGGIDVHTHLDMPFGGTTSADDFETGTRAAAFGGTTTIVDFAIQAKGTKMRDVIDTIVQRALADGKTAPIYHALTRPTRAEAEAVHRAIALAEMAGAPVYIVHLSSEDALNQVREARDRGLPAFAETCPQYLLLSIEELERPDFEGAKYVFTPPLREKHNLPKLWDGLKHDHLQVVSTDHCPFCFADQKQLGKDDFTKIPNGGPGIENRLQLIHHHGVNAGKISLNRFVELVSTTPARLFGMYPKKGALEVGSDADIVVWDPNAEHTISASTHHMRVDYSMFEGFQVRGNARQVLSRGEMVIDNGKFMGRAGRGNYLRRAARGGAWN